MDVGADYLVRESLRRRAFPSIVSRALCRSPMGVTTDEEDIFVELVTQTIDPKLFADRPAMGNVMSARYI